MKVKCNSCGQEINAKGRFHAGFGDVGFVYCDKDDTVLMWDYWDPMANKIQGTDEKMPWDLNDTEMERLDKYFLPCPCGGRFSFRNHLRCPRCGGNLSGPITETIYFIQLNRIIDGREQEIWNSKIESVSER